MRPIKLTMSAFGPYADKVEIELDKLGKSGLYLITGDTGAGKTTIFDGIVYALYGEASGANRDSGMLRSKYATDDTPTEVELVFECKNKRYTVRRSPEYDRPKSRGDGYTRKPAEATLEKPNGAIVTKTKDVTAAITEIIGIDRSQFLQIAMIAQGEFLKLLLASTEERSKIFRQIFKTDSFKALQEQLRITANELENERKFATQSVKQYIDGITCGEESSHRPELEAAKNDEMLFSDVIALVDALVREDSDALQQLKGEKEILDAELLKIQNELSTLEVQIATREWLAKSRVALADKERELQEVSARLEELKGKEPQMEQIGKEIARIEAEMARYLERKEQMELLKSSTDSLNKQREEKNALISTQGAMETELAAQKQERTSLEGVEAQRQLLLSEQERLLERIKGLKALSVDMSELEKGQAELSSAQAEFLRLDEIAKERSRIYNENYHSFLAEQAGILASSLTQGEPCPVCGSLEHPSPATSSHTAPTEAELEVLKAQSEQALGLSQEQSKKCATISASLDAARRSIDERLKALEISSSEELNKMSAIFEEELEAIKNNLVSADGRLSRKQTLDSQIPTQEEALQSCKQKITECEKQISALTQEVKGASERLTRLNAELSFESDERATEKKNLLIAELKAMKDALEECQEAHRMANEGRVRLSSTVKNFEAQLKDEKEIDGDALKAQAIDLLEKKSQIDSKNDILAARLDSNKRSLEKIKERSQELSKLDARYKWLIPLAKTANGTLSGKEKIMLETYVQMTYFDRILARAGDRLMIMSGGQYELRRKRDDNNKRSQVGLDLNIIDHHNGSERDVRTLSGGESFKASLALALGLSDEIQASAGGVVLDTMFVDEGFGSLDEESLETAMKALLGLADGNRLVGIISHVSELKSRIDKQIVVKKTKSGTSKVEIIT